MDIVFAEAVTQITTLPPEAQREIAVRLLGREVTPELPVIEYDAE